jgi:hypothetical protein
MMDVLFAFLLLIISVVIEIVVDDVNDVDDSIIDCAGDDRIITSDNNIMSTD